MTLDDLKVKMLERSKMLMHSGEHVLEIWQRTQNQLKENQNVENKASFVLQVLWPNIVAMQLILQRMHHVQLELHHELDGALHGVAQSSEKLAFLKEVHSELQKAQTVQRLATSGLEQATELMGNMV